MTCSHTGSGGRCTHEALPTASLCRIHRGFIPADPVPGSIGFNKRRGHDADCKSALSGWKQRCTC